MTAPVRRSVSLALLAFALCAAAPGCSMEPDASHHLAMAGGDLSDEAAQALERQLESTPGDVEARVKLLGYYFDRPNRSGNGKAARQGHILWLIRNRPEAPVLRTPFAHLDAILERSAYAEGRKAWLEQVERQPKNTAILGNAAAYSLSHDQDTAERLYKRAEAVEPQNPEWPRSLGLLYSLGLSSKQGEDRRQSAKVALDAYERSLRLAREPVLANAAKLALEAGDVAKARSYAEELLRAAGKDGDRIHQSNTVLGRIALRSGDVEQAKRHLIASAKTRGSPVLSSFGPNMSLAKELLEKGERQAVLDYFALCGIFWKDEELEAWTRKVEAGKVPDFGASLEP